MAECSEIGLMLGAAGDGELEPDHMQEIAHHLTRCDDCTIRLSDYAAIGRELKAIATMPSLEGFTKSVLAAITTLIAVAIFAIALHGNAIRLDTVTVTRSGTPLTSSTATAPIRMVEVQVDSAMILGQASASFIHTNLKAKSGKMLVFNVAPGKTLHVQPRVIDGDMIKLEVVLFDRGRPTMRTDVNLENGSTMTLSGEQFAEGTLLLRISPTTASTVARDPNPL